MNQAGALIPVAYPHLLRYVRSSHRCAGSAYFLLMNSGHNLISVTHNSISSRTSPVRWQSGSFVQTEMPSPNTSAALRG
jgi:hypothetical protein